MPFRYIDLNKDGLVLRLLTTTLFKTNNFERVKKSKFMYKMNRDGSFSLRPLGILHGLFGLVVNVRHKTRKYYK